MRKALITLFIGLLLALLPAALLAQNLEIHYINVQQGQSTLIIGPNGTKILYDAGYDFKGTNEVVPYLQSLGITTAQPLEYIVLSHHHTDHYAGLTEVINAGYDAQTVYDNGSSTTNSYFQQYEAAVATTTAGGLTVMQLGDVIDLGSGATATCVAVNGSVIGIGQLAGVTNENDLSICLLVKYGDFDFLVTGDLGGGSDDNACTGRSTSQANVETPLVQAITPGGAYPLLTAYGVEVAHIGHHGSESSGNSDYMNYLSPAVSCCSVGSGQSTNWYHPRIDVVENVFLAQVSCITAPPSLVLQTEEGDPTGTLTSYAGYCVGDIIITTDGGSTYTINSTGAVSQGPNETAAAGLPMTFYFDEVSGGDLPPILSNVHDENLGETSVDIAWITNEDADSTVKYGTASGSYTLTATDATMSTNHKLTLTGLSNNTTYYYIVESTDSASQTTASIEFTFTTTGPIPTPTTILFSEIFYDTPGTDSVEEWIELYNTTSSSIDLSGWTITDNNGTGGTLTIPAGTTIAPRSYLTVAVDATGFNALYGFDADVYTSMPGLNNTGDALILKNGSGDEIDAVAWEGGATAGVPADWGSTTAPTAPTGSTIVRTDPTVDTDTHADWSVTPNNGDPQTQASIPQTPRIVFSEIFYDTPGDETLEEWIEIYNNSPYIADLTGWTIIDNNGTGFTYEFPTGTTMDPFSYLTVGRDSAGFTALYGYEADLYGNLPYLNNGGDTLIIYDATGNPLDAVAWEGGASAGIPDGWGSTTDPWAGPGNTIVRNDVTVDNDTYSDWGYARNGGNPQTQGGTVLPKVVFSEIFYDTLGDENVEEWIEIYNNSTQTVDISGWTIIDNNDTGYTYTIPAGTTMKPESYMTIARDSVGFTAMYEYEADLYGSLPYLNNSGDTLILKDTESNVIDFVAWEGGASAGIPDGWGSTSNPWAGAGKTIVRNDVTVDTNTYADWGYATDGGNPQVQNPPLPKIVFSEIFYDTPGDENVEEWFELYNNSNKAVDIGGWQIIDNNGTGFTYTIPTGTVMAANTFMTIARNQAGFNALYGYDADLYGSLPYLNNGGDTLILYDLESNAVDAVAWEGGASAGIPDAWGSTSDPWASGGNTIVRKDVRLDSDTYEDWGYATNGGDPWNQGMGNPDFDPPVISGVTVDSITTDAAYIHWTTNEDADSVVEFGTVSGTYTFSESFSDMATAHDIVLSALTPYTTYYFVVKSTDEHGNEGVSSEYTFKTLGLMTTGIALEKDQLISSIYADAIITVSGNGQPLDGATVHIAWNDGTIDEAVTDANGEAYFRSAAGHVSGWEFTITITDVIKDGFVWDTANSEISDNIKKDMDGIASFLAFATNSIYMRTGVTVNSGNAGVLDVSPGPWLDGSQEVVLSTNVYFADNTAIYADKVKIKSRSSVNDVYTNALTNYGTVRGEEVTPLALPLNINVPTFPTPAPATTPVNLATHETLTLDPGHYGEVTLGTKAVLILTGGTYHFENIDLQPHAHIEFTGPTEVIVNNRIFTKNKNIYIGPAEGSDITAADIVFYVNGQNGISGELGDSPKAVTIGTHHTLKANIYAPNGTIWLKARSTAEGAFIGKDIMVEFYVQFTLNSIFE